MERLAFPFRLSVVLVLTGLSHGAGVLPLDLLNGPVGGSVMFATSEAENQFYAMAWRVLKDGHSVEANIVTLTSTNHTEAEYEGRITLYKSTGSLELRDLSLNDSGHYSVALFPVGGAQLTGGCRLVMYEPVSNVVVLNNNTDLLEFNSSARLSCSASGFSLSYRWLNGSLEVTASGRVQLGDGNSSLVIFNVTRYDRGPFRCQVFNPVSNKTSDPVRLSISYGPENVRIEGAAEIEVGQTLELYCIADCEPNPDFVWRLNGTEITGHDAALTKTASLTDSGEYTCQAKNSMTGKTLESRKHDLSVKEKALVHERLSVGAIAGITVACLLTAGGAVVLGYLSWRRCKSKEIYALKKPPIGNTFIGPGSGNDQEGPGDKGPIYAVSNGFQKRDAGSSPFQDQGSLFVNYAQVAKNGMPRTPSTPPLFDNHMQNVTTPGAQPASQSELADSRKPPGEVAIVEDKTSYN
ncbi:carcinoembryonic antigen-related cell adhesion molecule 6-like [Lampris incognitus]|uniref:carcinoembryonic antigen-related cell adhesion molecule 6-like n=1 Tax=Lampris incognitus TaxID=2546036 RepID=UPI0024B632E1|nr:carcinoembryonic antigen-related cell adhesion molecule 6-like [Lampris incognitus]